MQNGAANLDRDHACVVDADILTLDIPDAALERAAATHPGGAEGAMSFPNAPTVSILIMCCSFDGS
jgi:hypothetical protein